MTATVSNHNYSPSLNCTEVNLLPLRIIPSGTKMGLIPQGGSMDNEGNSYLLDSSHYKPGSDYAASVSSETSSENNLPGHDTEDASSSSTKDSRTKTNGSGKRARKLLTLEQSRVLHELLQQTCFPSTQVREAVAAQLGLSPRKVQVFFQNKRQKQRKRSNLSTSQPKETTPQALMQSCLLYTSDAADEATIV